MNPFEALGNFVLKLTGKSKLEPWEECNKETIKRVKQFEAEAIAMDRIKFSNFLREEPQIATDEQKAKASIPIHDCDIIPYVRNSEPSEHALTRIKFDLSHHGERESAEFAGEENNLDLSKYQVGKSPKKSAFYYQQLEQEEAMKRKLTAVQKRRIRVMSPSQFRKFKRQNDIDDGISMTDILTGAFVLSMLSDNGNSDAGSSSDSSSSSSDSGSSDGGGGGGGE